MEIKVNADILINVIEAIKQLPVQCDFKAADRWVGIVMVLEQMLQTPQAEDEEKGE